MAFDFLNQMLRYEPGTAMEDGQTCSDGLGYQDRSRAWSYGDGEASFYVRTDHRDKQPDINLRVGQQNAYQDSLNSDNPQPSSSHVGETGVNQNIGRSHLGETGVVRTSDGRISGRQKLIEAAQTCILGKSGSIETCHI